MYSLGLEMILKLIRCFKNGKLSTDRQDILVEWYKDFLSLYSPSFAKIYESTTFADHVVEELFEKWKKCTYN